MFIMGPYIITQFTGNINNFNVIYLLSAGKPTPVGETAGKTDLLVTWLYKLTVDYQYYNIGAVIGILTFVVLSIVALVTYRNCLLYTSRADVEPASEYNFRKRTEAEAGHTIWVAAAWPENICSGIGRNLCDCSLPVDRRRCQCRNGWRIV